MRLNAELHQHGVPELSEMSGLSVQKVEALLIERTRAELKKPPGGKTLVMLPLGTLLVAATRERRA